MAKRVSIINFKGGVGKTTLSTQLAAGLVRFHGARVLLVDVDHQSSLSIVCLGAGRWQEAVNAGQTISSVFKHFTDSSHRPGNDIIVENAITNDRIGHYAALDIVPASLELDDLEIELTATHQGNAIESEWRKRTLICSWIDRNEIDEAYDYILFDCPPATKIVSQNAIAASHCYVVPVVPEAVMERGAPHLVQMIRTGIDRKMTALAAMGEDRASFVPETSLVGLAVTRIRTHGPAASGFTDDHTVHLRSLQRQWQSDLLQPYIHEGTGVSQALADNVPVFDRSNTQNIGYRQIDTMYEELVEAIKDRVDAI